MRSRSRESVGSGVDVEVVRGHRLARIGVSLMFLTNGAMYSALLPRYPELKESFGLSNTAFGLAVVAFPVGAICAATVAAPLIRRFGAARVAMAGSVLLAMAMAAAGLAPVVAVFVIALAAGGLMDVVVDAAQNVEGVAVERAIGSSVINSLHAVWSLGAVLGGLLGAAAAGLGVDVGLQMVVSGIVWSVVAVVAMRLAQARVPQVEPRAEATAGATSSLPRARWLLLPLGVLAICGALVEDVANNWSALFLRQELQASIGVAGLAYSVVVGAQFVGRIVGDPMTDRWGRGRVARFGGLAIATGMVAVAVAPHVAVAFGGLALAGFGSATLIPAAYAAADRIPGLAAGTGIAVLSWLLRVGFLVTSPAIGSLSDATSLRIALAIPVLAGLAAAAMAQLQTRRPG